MLPHFTLRFHRPKASPPHARLLAMIALASAIVFGASTARSAPKDGEAADLLKKAINVDYLNTKFADAEKKLKQAISLCKPKSACTPAMRAQLFSNLGTVYAGGMSRPADATAAFAEALKNDPNVVPNPDLVSPEVEAAFNNAKKGGGAAAPPEEEGDTTAKPAPEAKSSGGGTPSDGGLIHTPPAEQATLTPVPIYAELPSGQTAKRVQVSYKPWGGGEWKSLEMKHTGKGYGIEIPCVELGAAGDLSYYIQALDADGSLVVWSGTKSEPNKVPIKPSLDGEPPHLPGQPPSARCADTGDCPPDFPGCHKDEPKTEECPPDQECPKKEAEVAEVKNWISIGIQQDFLFMPAADDACATNDPYVCFDGNGNYYNGIPYKVATDPNPAKYADQANSGISVATTRILAGFDRVLGAAGPGNFVLGARLGFAFRGGPKVPDGASFLPLHAEGRIAYWIGKNSFSTQTFRPYFVLGGGLAQVDGSENIIVYLTQAKYAKDQRTTLAGYKRAGTGFVQEGVGAMFAITPHMGPLLEFKFMELLGKSGTAMNLELGYAVGF